MHPTPKVDANGNTYFEDNTTVQDPRFAHQDALIARAMEAQLAQRRQQHLAEWMANRPQASGRLPEGMPAYIGGYQAPMQNAGPNAPQPGSFQPASGMQSEFDVQRPAQELSYTQAGQGSGGRNFRQSVRGVGQVQSPFGPTATPRPGTTYY
jgi:hypothetical protein